VATQLAWIFDFLLRLPKVTARLEQKVAAAAASLFSARGYEQTTIRELAELAGVATGTVFLYAEDKQALLAKIYCAEVEAVRLCLFADAAGVVPHA
jgi:AcrR family transcriptional regulator